MITVDPPVTNISAGSVDTITCTARGFPFTDIYWQRNGVNVTDIPSSVASYTQTVSEPNVTNLTVVGTLGISGPVLSTQGNFSCIATNYLVTFEAAFSKVVDVFVQCKVDVFFMLRISLDIVIDIRVNIYDIV